MDRNEKGLTLIELMISMAVLVTIVASTYYVLLVAHSMSEESRGRLLALHAARSTLEEIKNTSLEDIGNINVADFLPQNLPQAAITIDTNPSPVGSAQIATVTVSVSWRGPRNRQSVLEMTTMRSRF